MRKFAYCLIALGLVATSAGGAEKFDPAARAAAIAPFIDEQTGTIVRIDMTRMDPAAMAEQILAYAKASGLTDEDVKGIEKAIRKPLKIVGTEWIEAFRKAGGKDLYMVFSLGYGLREPVFWVAPLGEGGDAKAIGALLVSGKADGAASRPRRPNPFFPCARGTATLHKAVCAAPASTLEALRKLRPHPRPNLVKAFAAAGDTAVQALLLPTDDTRRVIEETLPELPKELGGGPSTAVTRGLLWAAAGVNAPPKLSLTLTVQSKDAESAKALLGVIRSTLETLGKSRGVKNFQLPAFDKLAAALTPQADGDKLLLTLSGEQVDALVAVQFGPWFIRARGQARRAMSAANINAIGKAVYMYATENKDQFPPDLSALKSYLGPAWKKMLTNPLRPELEVGYVYVRPAAKMSDVKDLGNTIMLYEAHEKWGEGVWVGFAAGNVKFIADQARFKELLKKKGK